jgi:hypothetical protein
MKDSDVRGKVGKEQGRLLPDVPPAPGRDGVRNAPEPAERKAEEEWLEFATEDPAFFIKHPDTV